MSLEDPFFVVKDEVHKAVQNARSLYQRWTELSDDPVGYSKDELEWTTNELRNSLRSIEWDLEDLEETISIVEKNPKKFKIDSQEIRDRRDFVQRTKSSITEIKSRVSNPQPSKFDSNPKQPLVNGPSKPQDKYTRLDNEIERSNQHFIEDTHSQQQLMMESQDDQLDRIHSSVGVLKNVSSQIGSELDEQQVMLDDFAHEMDTTDTKMDGVMKKMAKVMHMSNDRRQWMAIGVLVLVLFVVIILFFIL